MEQWLNIKQTCEMLGVTANTVRKLIRTGVLPAREITGVRGFQIKREDVESLIKPVKVKKPSKKSVKKQ
jgi:excisionase family DNA binding protein